MAIKNKFLADLQAKRLAHDMVTAAEQIALTQQGMTDAIMLTLGYGSCMKNDPWGEKRIMEFVEEVRENYRQEIFPGIAVKTDSDGHRGHVDELLQKKCPHHFVPWKDRYPFWKEETIEEEAAREKKAQKKAQNRKKGKSEI